MTEIPNGSYTSTFSVVFQPVRLAGARNILNQRCLLFNGNSVGDDLRIQLKRELSLCLPVFRSWENPRNKQTEFMLTPWNIYTRKVCKRLHEPRHTNGKNKPPEASSLQCLWKHIWGSYIQITINTARLDANSQKCFPTPSLPSSGKYGVSAAYAAFPGKISAKNKLSLQ